MKIDVRWYLKKTICLIKKWENKKRDDKNKNNDNINNNDNDNNKNNDNINNNNNDNNNNTIIRMIIIRIFMTITTQK